MEALRSFRRAFDGLARSQGGRPLAYMDNAATTYKPRPVLEAIARYDAAPANVHRSAHGPGADATEAYEGARARVARRIGAAHASEVLFTKGCTEGLNLLAQTLGRSRVGPGDEVLVTELEHHSNFVPWQQLCMERGAHLRVVPLEPCENLGWHRLGELVGRRTRVVALTGASNLWGVRPPLRAVTDAAHQVGAAVVVDGAQLLAHGPVDVGALGCDFFAFSGHKVFGPTGVGVVWARGAPWDDWAPWQVGGGMVDDVSVHGSTFRSGPQRFEAGTPPIAQAIGLAEALDFVGDHLGPELVDHERRLLARTHQVLRDLKSVRVLGPPPRGEERAPVVSFALDGVHPHDVGTLLDAEGIAVRAGHHCCQPALKRLGLNGAVRVSMAPYNTEDEVERLGPALRQVERILGPPR